MLWTKDNVFCMKIDSATAWLLATFVRQEHARSRGDGGDLSAMPSRPIPVREFYVVVCCDGCLVSLRPSPDLHLPPAKRWPGTSVAILVPPRNIESRFCTSAERVVRGVPSRRDLAAEQGGKFKGCDIGYALAACSREGASNVDARTVTAF